MNNVWKLEEREKWNVCIPKCEFLFVLCVRYIFVSVRACVCMVDVVAAYRFAVYDCFLTSYVLVAAAFSLSQCLHSPVRCVCCCCTCTNIVFTILWTKTVDDRQTQSHAQKHYATHIHTPRQRERQKMKFKTHAYTHARPYICIASLCCFFFHSLKQQPLPTPSIHTSMCMRGVCKCVSMCKTTDRVDTIHSWLCISNTLTHTHRTFYYRSPSQNPNDISV